ncbi:hypothetical protein E5A73_14225 [Sphingomonas gei]|uniref:Putative Flp pilus-assembly TadG-like N-terminal domain-containing protein n=2 Tax=Sphingomonas gei TaxID=1395960 RepID=A0A4S1XAT2_9SPHN|nr:hypothetical protein E5A73_14225 [Sphingomonas gei]
MAAAFIIPLAAFAGSAIDVGRLYVVKGRLQQACDAGVLAGRKSMTDTSPSTPLDSVASAQAQSFFVNNFRAGWFGTSNVAFAPSKTADSQVAGTAAATVPLTLMAIFGNPSQTISVSCEARYDIADADIMLVLDTTGSMACLTSDGTAGCSQAVASYTRADGTTGYYVTEKSGSKLSGLRSAVLTFYDTLMANVDSATHIRYGFVPYTSTANVGRLLPSTSFVTTWSYQTRKIAGDANNGSATSATSGNTSQNTCNGYAGRVPSGTNAFTTSGTATVRTVSWSTGSGGYCTVYSQPVKPLWSYGKWPLDVSQYVAGNAVDDPSKITAATSTWQGCIEERDTTASSSFSAASLPADLDPDLPATTDATRWRPMWPDVIYYRGSSMNPVSDSGSSTNPYGDTTSTTGLAAFTSMQLYNNIALGYVSCGKPAQRLATMARADVSAYLNSVDFKAQGGTYHDTGMIWGTRLLSPTGLFAADTSAWPGRNAPNRYIVFMTDGDMAPNQNIYGMYGLEYYDKRVTGGSYSNDETYHNARFVAECGAAKTRGITVFVISFGQTLTPELTSCATPGQAYYASDNTALTNAFRAIADQVAMLRISK